MKTRIHPAAALLAAALLAAAHARAVAVPAYIDTDGDGWSDAQEVAAETSPNSSESYPSPPLWLRLLNMPPGVWSGACVRVEAYIPDMRYTNSAPDEIGPFAVWVVAPPRGYLPSLAASGPDSYLPARLVSGRPRADTTFYWAYLDCNGNGRFDLNEPAGFSEQGIAAVGSTNAADVAAFVGRRRLNITMRGEPSGWWSADAGAKEQTPLTTEGPFGFPRIDISGSTNASDYVTVVFSRFGDDGALGKVRVRKPRGYLHENDYLVNGSAYSGSGNPFAHGIPFGAAIQQVIVCDVYDSDDETQDAYKSIEIPMSLGYQYHENTLSVRQGRREMVPIYPTQGTTVHNSPVELQWRMDHRTMGVYLTLRDDNEGRDVFANRYVPFPHMRGQWGGSDAGYYLYEISASHLVSGHSYTWTVRENLNSISSSAVAQTCTGSFVWSAL